MRTPAYLEAVDRVVAEVVGPAAQEVDALGAFPRDGMDALARAGLLGLVSATEAGGQGQGVGAAARVVEHLGHRHGAHDRHGLRLHRSLHLRPAVGSGEPVRGNGG